MLRYYANAHHPRMVFKRFTRWVVVVLLLLAVGIGIGVGFRAMQPRLTEEEVQSVVVSTIQREAPASFYVTGYLDVVVTSTVANTKTLFPDLFDIDLGTTRSTVRMPGRVSYGFDVRRLRPEMIEVGDDGVVRVTLPELEIYSAEPQLANMEVQTDVGWARLHRSSGRRVEQRAIQAVQRALREQGGAHIQSSTQPRINTAEAMKALLTPVLEAAGIDRPRFAFHIGPELVMEPEG